MIRRHLPSNVFVAAVVALTSLALSGGCVPVETSDLNAFIGDLLLNAAAALLL